MTCALASTTCSSVTLMAPMRAADVARILGGAVKNGTGWLCRCPVPSYGRGRGDRTRSLLITDGERGGFSCGALPAANRATCCRSCATAALMIDAAMAPCGRRCLTGRMRTGRQHIGSGKRRCLRPERMLKPTGHRVGWCCRRTAVRSASRRASSIRAAAPGRRWCARCRGRTGLF